MPRSPQLRTYRELQQSIPEIHIDASQDPSCLTSTKAQVSRPRLSFRFLPPRVSPSLPTPRHARLRHFKDNKPSREAPFIKKTTVGIAKPHFVIQLRLPLHSLRFICFSTTLALIPRTRPNGYHRPLFILLLSPTGLRTRNLFLFFVWFPSVVNRPTATSSAITLNLPSLLSHHPCLVETRR